MNERLERMRELGQAPWVDELSREDIQNGGLQRMIEDGLVGVTSNPAIFQKAIAGSDLYDEQLHELAKETDDPKEMFWEVAGRDIRDACDIFMPVHEETGGVDGFVSLEVQPDIAYDTEATVEEATRLHEVVDRPNLFVKIPATLPGLVAIEEMISRGKSINVTLIFSLERYRAVINAFQSGLEQAKENGHDLSKIHSVASFFVSRVDSEIDKRLDAIGTDEAKALKGKAGVANARLAYQVYEELFSTERWAVLAEAGALPQRPLWASTGVKDPAYPDTLYVTELVAAGVVNTMPEKTLDATFDHGVVTGDTITGTYDEANETLNALEALGVSYNDVVTLLETEGLEKFVGSWKELLADVEGALVTARKAS